MPIESEFVASPPALQRLAPDWRALEARNPSRAAWLSYDYFMAWCRSFGEHVRCGVLTLRRDGALVAIMPLMMARCWRGPALSVRFDFHPEDTKFLREKSRWRCLPVNQLSPPLSVESGNLRGGSLTEPAENHGVLWRHLASGLARIPGWSIGVFPLPLRQREAMLGELADGRLAAFVRPSDRRFYSCERMRPWDEIVKGMSHNARKSINRAMRRAEEAGLRSVVLDRREDLAEGFRHLSLIAQLSWKATGRDGSPIHVPYTERQRSFYESLGAAESTHMQPVIFCLFQGEQCRAAAVTIRNGSSLTGGVTCYAPEIAELYPGRLIMKAMMDWAVANDIRRFDFNATDTWVGPFSDRVEEYGQLILFKRHLYGRLLHATARRLAKAAPPLSSAAQVG